MHNKHKRNVLVCTLVVTVCGCARSSKAVDQPPQQAFVYEQRMGLMRWHENRGCLAVFNTSVTPRTRVALVNQPASADPPSVTEASVVERVSQACDQGLSFTNSKGVAPSFYRVTTVNGELPYTAIVFAILDPPGPLVVRDGHVEADLDGDGAKESFRVCNSAENVHFMAWTGSPGQGRPRWHGYYYVGYDMDPSCTDQDVAGMIALEKREASRE